MVEQACVVNPGALAATVQSVAVRLALVGCSRGGDLAALSEVVARAVPGTLRCKDLAARMVAHARRAAQVTTAVAEADAAAQGQRLLPAPLRLLAAPRLMWRRPWTPQLRNP